MPPDDDEPKFLKDPPTEPLPRSALPRAAATVASRLAEDRRRGGEDAGVFVVRAGAAYMASAWDDAPSDEPRRRTAAGPCSLDVPRGWGDPHSQNGGLVWSLDDCEVVLLAAGGLSKAPTAEAWVDVRRGQMRDGWIVAAGRPIPHPQGAAVETCEICRVAPRAVRTARFLFRPPVLITFAIVTPDILPDHRGRQLAAAFASLRVDAG